MANSQFGTILFALAMIASGVLSCHILISTGVILGVFVALRSLDQVRTTLTQEREYGRCQKDECEDH
jgi:hypothetical protein